MSRILENSLVLNCKLFAFTSRMSQWCCSFVDETWSETKNIISSGLLRGKHMVNWKFGFSEIFSEWRMRLQQSRTYIKVWDVNLWNVTRNRVLRIVYYMVWGNVYLNSTNSSFPKISYSVTFELFVLYFWNCDFLPLELWAWVFLKQRKGAFAITDKQSYRVRTIGSFFCQKQNVKNFCRELFQPALLFSLFSVSSTSSLSIMLLSFISFLLTDIFVSKMLAPRCLVQQRRGGKLVVTRIHFAESRTHIIFCELKNETKRTTYKRRFCSHEDRTFETKRADKCRKVRVFDWYHTQIGVRMAQGGSNSKTKSQKNRKHNSVIKTFSVYWKWELSVA